MNAVPLEQAHALGSARCGAKAARLSAARGLGLPVLPGRVFAPDHLQDELVVPAKLHALFTSDPPRDGPGRRALRTQLASLANEIQWRVSPNDALADVLAELTEASALHGVIVRSSATVEDGARFSWAGIFNSVFCPPTPQALAEAIRAVWASQWHQAAFYYAHRTGQSTEVSMAILIQPAITPVVGGVAFSRTPLQPSSQRRLIEATWGLPKAVVDGDGGVDRYTCLPGARQTERSVGHKTEHLVLESGEVKTRPVAIERRDAACLTDDHVAEIDRLLARLESHFDGPQDIEWAFLKTSPVLLQVRPQTQFDALGMHT